MLFQIFVAWICIKQCVHFCSTFKTVFGSFMYDVTHQFVSWQHVSRRPNILGLFLNHTAHQNTFFSFETQCIFRRAVALKIYLELQPKLNFVSGLCLFKVSNIINVVLTSLLFTSSRFHTLFCCFHCWLWTTKCWRP